LEDIRKKVEVKNDINNTTKGFVVGRIIFRNRLLNSLKLEIKVKADLEVFGD